MTRLWERNTAMTVRGRLAYGPLVLHHEHHIHMDLALAERLYETRRRFEIVSDGERGSLVWDAYTDEVVESGWYVVYGLTQHANRVARRDCVAHISEVVPPDA